MRKQVMIFFKSLKRKGKLTEKELEYFTISYSKVTNVKKSTCYLKFIKGSAIIFGGR